MADVLDFDGIAISGARIETGAGNDTVGGSAGADIILGGSGTDTLSGRGGNDIFDYNAATDSPAGSGRDRITDFVSGQDKIDLSTIDAITSTSATNDAFLFIGTGNFTGNKGEVRYQIFDNAGTDNDFTLVQFDSGGTIAADLEIRLDGIQNLQSTDFVL